MSTAPRRLTADIIHVEPWDDPSLDSLGHDARSRYVELFWLPILGPSTVWLVRRLARGLDESPQGFDLDLADTAATLGLGSKPARNSPFARALVRSAQFGLTFHIDHDRMAARRRIPPLTPGQVRSLPASLAHLHDGWTRREMRSASGDDAREQARRLALSLVEVGEDAASVEEHLTKWRFDQVVAAESASWAETVHAVRATQAPDASLSPGG